MALKLFGAMPVSAQTIDADLLSRLEEAWQGEVFGMAMYSAMADAQSDTFRRWQWQVLYQLEVETGDAMRQLLLRHGGNTVEDAASRQAGEAEARRISGLPWLEMMDAFADDLPATVDEYEKLERDCAFEGEDARAVRLLVEHEVVSLAFARSELDGNSRTSIEPVLALLKAPPPNLLDPPRPKPNPGLRSPQLGRRSGIQAEIEPTR